MDATHALDDLRERFLDQLGALVRLRLFPRASVNQVRERSITESPDEIPDPTYSNNLRLST
jgi:hypothetical protein